MTGVNKNVWGNMIQTLREDQHMSQRRLAHGAKVNRSTLRRIEAGTASCEIEIIERLLSYLGYELDAIEVSSREQRIKTALEQEKDPKKRSVLASRRLMLLSSTVG
jgi:transcriptional regulator with XRE-family HTH domain